MNPAEATREILWNVGLVGLMYALLVPTAAIAGWGLYRRLRLWRRGAPAMRWDRPLARLGLTLRHALAQGRTARQAYAGTLHLSIFAGFIVLTIATIVVMLDYDFGTSILRGGFYLYFQSFTVDVFGVLVLVGVVMAAWRRWVAKPRQLVYTGEASWILVAVFVIVVTGFLVEGWRIAATSDPWAAFSPFGNLVARVSTALAGAEALTSAHAVAWWTHLVLVYAFLAWAPYTKLLHVVTAPLNIFFANLDGYGRALRPIDFGDVEDEEEVPFGVNDLARFTWKDLFDLDACTECGRCSAVCPAHVSGKELSPRDIVLDLRSLMHENAEKLLDGGNGKAADEPLIPTIRDDNALSPASLWACTTCAACMEACPVYIEQLPKILDARRYQVMEEADLPQTMADALTSLERRGHPYPGTRLSRLDWAEGLDVPVLGDMEEASTVDVLLWVGCATALLERNHATGQSLARLLRQAGVSFAILGNEERCTGDPARRIGNEFLYERLARKTISTLQKYHVKKIVTPCPHCFNTFHNDYPALGAEYEVHHHSTFLSQLVADGKLQGAAGDASEVTFHDPCYLGRYNQVFDEPRELVRISTGKEPVEMAQSRASSFCCGGGGGMSFTEEPAEQRVNRQRARQALETGATTVAVACPFCTTMLEDGIAAVADEKTVEVKDVAELLWESVERAGAT